MAIGVEEATFGVGWTKCFKVFCNWRKLKLLGQCGTKFQLFSPIKLVKTSLMPFNYVYQISNQSNNFNIVFWGVG